MGKKVAVAAVVLVAVFLAGFLPQFLKRNSLESQWQEATRQNREAQVRDLAAFAYVQASQKNYGLAAQTASDFFGRVQQLAAERPGAARRPLEEILGWRDKITAELAKGDPAALGDLQTVYLKTRGATGL